MQFKPGTNWSYAHTNFMILGHILSIIGKKPLATLLQEKVLGPMGLTNTTSSETSTIPEPVLHSYSSERKEALHIPSKVNFYEEATYWNADWGTPVGANQTTNIYDMTKTAVAVGTGQLLSRSSYHAMTDPNLLGFGHEQSQLRAQLLQADTRLQLRAGRGAVRIVDPAEPAGERLQRHGGVPSLAEDRHRRGDDLRCRAFNSEGWSPTRATQSSG